MWTDRGELFTARESKYRLPKIKINRVMWSTCSEPILSSSCEREHSLTGICSIFSCVLRGNSRTKQNKIKKNQVSLTRNRSKTLEKIWNRKSWSNISLVWWRGWLRSSTHYTDVPLIYWNIRVNFRKCNAKIWCFHKCPWAASDTQQRKRKIMIIIAMKNKRRKFLRNEHRRTFHFLAEKKLYGDTKRPTRVTFHTTTQLQATKWPENSIDNVLAEMWSYVKWSCGVFKFCSQGHHMKVLENGRLKVSSYDWCEYENSPSSVFPLENMCCERNNVVLLLKKWPSLHWKPAVKDWYKS